MYIVYQIITFCCNGVIFTYKINTLVQISNVPIGINYGHAIKKFLEWTVG